MKNTATKKILAPASFILLLSVSICVHLCSIPLATAQQPTTLAPPQQIAVDWEKANAEAIALLREYIRVETVNPPGTETRGAEWFAKVFERERIPYETAESAPGRGNIVARLKGSGKKPGLILLSHIDVVPVNREFWTVEPFAGELRDGYLWGRGTSDMKGQAIAQLMAFLLLHRARAALDRDVIFLATADEEAGGDFGAGWVVKNRPQWIAGAEFLITEGGNSPAKPNGSPLYIGVGPTEKTPAWLLLTSKGTPGHGSVPRTETAVTHLVAALERVRNWQRPLEVTPPIERALRTLAPYESEPWRSRFLNIRAFVKQPGARHELEKRPAILALLTNTVNITGLTGSNKINIVPPVATAQLDCRLLPGWTIERWIAEVKKVLRDDKIEVSVVLNFPSTESPVDTPLYAAIEAAVRAVHDGADKEKSGVGVAHSIISGFTDSHFFRERGIVSYGIGPFALKDEDNRTVHGNDERIPVRSFTDGLRLTWEIVYGFARTP